MIPFILIISTILVTHPVLHWYLIEYKHTQIDHPLHTLLASVGILGVSMVAIIQGVSIQSILLYLIIVPAMRWLIHDALLNILRDKDPNYLGSEAATDKFLVYVYASIGLRPIDTKIAWMILSLLLSLIINHHL